MPSTENRAPNINGDIRAAAAVLRAGGLVAFPTETVYGLGADASNSRAVRRIFEAKGRPADHPLIVHLADVAQLGDWAREIPEAARRLAARFWPGPLTLVLRASSRVPREVTGGQDSVGLRMPDHPLALALLRTFGGGLAAPSANRFGRVSPTTAAHVREELGDRVDLILDGGPCPVGVESTILSLAGGAPELLRPGGLPLAALEQALGTAVARRPAAGATLRAPGMLAAHYAPATPLELRPAAALASRAAELAAQGLRVGVLEIAGGGFEPGASERILRHCMPADPIAYARGLYAALREMDRVGLDCLLAQAPPEGDAWLAINDRLQRAAQGRQPHENA